ncbi:MULTISPECIES: type II toxin-antitoxin system Phd/YefM family antitoxin [unclassified Pseudactinotalea]|uniref:type II toxin-antitoxin system Phd/YefM family antitoxin n=1 Tax=unclassified Pseudactinotalea TaxID=2649176 RepID=UPI00128D687E|nr:MULTISPECIES: type II toxin-antitoxin system Phd/YefM family antitoxin [unclassified Pseudactinotalea]MPV50774.1 type II toxin-antitoxin system prevent-host-death family antitoxin [Pseudactinotalea sp. HY160]QGH70374.1 type II toxin-antitoxin system prevent-host-death family antitoxin [Pseudactinotalea sp. HY158]
METMSISAAKARLNDLVEQAVTTHERVMITRNGSPAAVMVSADEWDAIQETLFWLSRAGVADDVARGRSEDEAGQTFSETDVRARLGRPARG